MELLEELAADDGRARTRSASAPAVPWCAKGCGSRCRPRSSNATSRRACTSTRSSPSRRPPSTSAAGPRDGQAEPVRLTAVSPEGSRVELLPGIYRDPRPDVDSFYEEPTRTGAAGTGFLGFCETRAPSLLSTGWLLEMENALGVTREVPGPQVSRDLLAARAAILSDLHKERRWDTPLMDHVVPAVSLIQERLEAAAKIERVWQYGEPPQTPTVSIVVPLYGRIDFLEHQLAQFVHDPEMREADLIYVLDSPELAAALENAAGQLFELYGLPFRVAVLSQNGGYSVANNRGASLAEGRLLLLLNSDVLPDEPGWLEPDGRVLRRARGRRPGAEAAVRGRHPAARRDPLPAPARRRRLGERALLQGPAPRPAGGQRHPRRARPSAAPA